MLRTAALILGFALDLALGDPEGLPHPVVGMGRTIERLERFLRARLPKTPRAERLGGGILALLLVAATGLLGAFCLRAAGRAAPLLGFALESFIFYQCLSLRGLADAGTQVFTALTESGLVSGRAAVARIVGRDTAALDEGGVIRAAVESLAENFTDGVAAPMLYFAVGGAPLALMYKAVNTMDSMLGYQNERYVNFGRVPARLDDAVNFLPARLAALLWITAAQLCGFDGHGALRVFLRDRRKHPSPNSAQTESACAGALGVRLGGPSVYFGAVHEKPWLGDEQRMIEPGDILKTRRMLFCASALCLALCAAARSLWLSVV